MAIKTTLAPPVLFVRWVDAAEAQDVQGILVALEQAHARIGGDLVYLAIIPLGLRPPDGPAREALREGTDRAVALCKSVHVVIEGSGFRRAMMRSITAGLLLATGRGGKRFQIHEEVSQALASAGLAPARAVEVLAGAAAADILTVV